MTWKTCKLHGDDKPGVWGCPECLREENVKYRELLRELLVQLCENPGIREDGNAPGHAHEVPGVWDSDNDELAGKACAWCAVWAKAVANGLVGSNAALTGAEGVRVEGTVRGLATPKKGQI